MHGITTSKRLHVIIIIIRRRRRRRRSVLVAYCNINNNEVVPYKTVYNVLVGN